VLRLSLKWWAGYTHAELPSSRHVSPKIPRLPQFLRNSNSTLNIVSYSTGPQNRLIAGLFERGSSTVSQKIIKIIIIWNLILPQDSATWAVFSEKKLETANPTKAGNWISEFVPLGTFMNIKSTAGGVLLAFQLFSKIKTWLESSWNLLELAPVVRDVSRKGQPSKWQINPLRLSNPVIFRFYYLLLKNELLKPTFEE
jgi:hypothetical protein